MYVKVEPEGCCERSTYTQVKLSFYLDPDDHGYDIHHVQVEEIWQNNPFHNHFIQIEPSISDDDLMDEAEKLLKDSYKEWKKDNPPHLINTKKEHKERTPERIVACEEKVQHLKETPLERHPGGEKWQRLI